MIPQADAQRVPPVDAQREPLIDALRGAALFGILAVNIQSYVSGLNGTSLGVLDATSSAADQIAVAVIAFFLQYKFYPLFCFCFGYGFALQTRRWRARGLDAARRFGRRTDFLIRLGVLHGVLLWFGDILTSYGIAGKLLAGQIGKGPKRLLPTLRFWGIATLIVAVPVTILLTADLGGGSVLVSHDIAANRRDYERAVALYTGGPWLETLGQRIGDYLVVTLGFLYTGAELIFIMLLGAWCALAGVLRRPERYPAFWQKVLTVSLWVGIPVNLAFALAAFSHAGTPFVPLSVAQALPGGFAPILSAVFVALLVRWRETWLVSFVVRLAAPAGRYALTHYLMQSLLMFLLLGGSGLALGASLRQADLLTLAAAIFVVQLAISHWMAANGIDGPMERLWRRYTQATQ